MKRTVATRTLCAGLVTACLACAAPAVAGIRVKIVIFPPPEFVATVEPVYYEGHAVYWYHDHWYYRHGRGWRLYEQEPVYLREHRTRHETVRHYYGRREHDYGRRQRDEHRRH